MSRSSIGVVGGLSLGVGLAISSGLEGCALEFACIEDRQCALEDRVGTCEPDGFCSFPDASCESGRRYHRSAGSSVANVCTEPSASSSGESSDASDGSASSGPSPEPRCGDGVVDADEDCDDGNAVDGDGCNIDCVPSGEVLWNAEYDGLDDGDDDAWGIVLGPAGEVFVAGRVGLDGASRTAAWVRCYDADGNELWTREVIHGDAGQDGALSLALGSSGALLVGGWAATTTARSAEGDQQDFWLGRLDASDGRLDAETIFDGTGGNDRLRGLSLAPSGDVLAAGWSSAASGTGDDDLLWYGRFDPQTLELAWSQTFDSGTGGDDRAQDVVALPTGGLVVVGVEDRVGRSRAWLRTVDDDGTPQQTLTSEAASLWNAAAVVPEGSDLLVAGIAFDGLGRAVVQRRSPAGEVLWTGGYGEPETSEQDEAYSMAAGPSGEFVVVGRVKLGDDEDGWDAWVSKFDAQGNHLWTRTHRGSAGSNDVASDVAIDRDGAVVLVGYRVSAVDGRNIWVRKYTP